MLGIGGDSIRQFLTVDVAAPKNLPTAVNDGTLQRDDDPAADRIACNSSGGFEFRSAVSVSIAFSAVEVIC